MAEILSAAGSDAERASDAPLTFVPNFARMGLSVALSVASGAIAAGLILDAIGRRSDAWSELLLRSAFGGLGGALVFVWIAASRMGKGIVVVDGCVAGPYGRRRAKFDLRELDRARLAADLGSRWRRAFGFSLRSIGGEKIHLDWSWLRRADRERLLRALGVARTSDSESRPTGARAGS